MKCIRCGVNSRYRERYRNSSPIISRCKNCGHEFVFEPKGTTYNLPIKITDLHFLNVINKISSNSSIYFTQKQLNYALLRKNKKTKFLSKYSFREMNFYDYMKIISVPIGLLCMFSLLVVIRNPTIGFYIFCTGFFIEFLQRRRYLPTGIQVRKLNFNSRTLEITPDQLEFWIQRWININERVQNLLYPLVPLAQQVESHLLFDLDSRYHSFDKLLVVDTREIAYFLISNNFHFENSCAILSVDGYPEYIFDSVLNLVKQNPNLKVYALHDCTPRGISLVHTLRNESRWFSSLNIPIYDIGLSVHQILRQLNIFVQYFRTYTEQAKLLPQSVLQNLSPEEQEWITSGLFVNLKSITPKKLLRVVARSIRQTRDFETVEDVNNSNNWRIIDDDGEIREDGIGLSFTLEDFG